MGWTFPPCDFGWNPARERILAPVAGPEPGSGLEPYAPTFGWGLFAYADSASDRSAYVALE